MDREQMIEQRAKWMSKNWNLAMSLARGIARAEIEREGGLVACIRRDIEAFACSSQPLNLERARSVVAAYEAEFAPPPRTVEQIAKDAGRLRVRRGDGRAAQPGALDGGGNLESARTRRPPAAAEQRRGGDAMSQRVSDEDVAHVLSHGRVTEFYMNALLDLRDARAEAARWQAVADELAGALAERGEHHWTCNRADFRAGRPREDGGYEVNYGGTWYESSPADCTPRCDCEMGAALARYDAAKKEVI